MVAPLSVPELGRAASAILVSLVLSSCGGGGGGGSTPPSVSEPAPVPGATRVTGSERMAWNQGGDLVALRFLLYIDGNPMWLDAATCNTAAPERECTSPLPSLTDGVHTLALAAVSAASGVEGPRSDAITVQKVSARSVASGAGNAGGVLTFGQLGAGSVVTAPDGRAFDVDVVTGSFTVPFQLAATRDGRLVVAEGDGRVRVVYPDQPDRGGLALDTGRLSGPQPLGPLAVALHPDFGLNRFVYVAFLADDSAGGQRLRIVRVREAGDTLGEAATIFEAPLRATSPDVGGATSASDRVDGASTSGPRLAFGPDGLMYVLLPSGVEFRDEPGASQPLASMLRLTDEGTAPGGSWADLPSHPLGFAWHPATASLVGIVPGRDGEAEIRGLGVGPSAFVPAAGAAALRLGDGGGVASRALVIGQLDAGGLAMARAFLDGLARGASGAVRLAVPVDASGLLPGVTGQILDVVTDGSGAVFLAMAHPEADGAASPRAGFVVRLTPSTR